MPRGESGRAARGDNSRNLAESFHANGESNLIIGLREVGRRLLEYVGSGDGITKVALLRGIAPSLTLPKKRHYVVNVTALWIRNNWFRPKGKSWRKE